MHWGGNTEGPVFFFGVDAKNKIWRTPRHNKILDAIMEIKYFISCQKSEI
jgi:hypothetical protein